MYLFVIVPPDWGSTALEGYARTNLFCVSNFAMVQAVKVFLLLEIVAQHQPIGNVSSREHNVRGECLGVRGNVGVGEV